MLTVTIGLKVFIKEVFETLHSTNFTRKLHYYCKVKKKYCTTEKLEYSIDFNFHILSSFTFFFRYNLSHLEEWLRESKLGDSGALAAIEPIVQASHLLQARKTDTDVDSICDMCSRLTTSQVNIFLFRC